MKLSNVEICNFRSIEKLTINFDPACKVLVGINESGKSNILKALSLLDQEATVEPDDIREQRPDEAPIKSAYVDFDFSVDDKDCSIAKKEIIEIIDGDVKSEIIMLNGNRLNIDQFIDSRKSILVRVNLLENRRIFSYYALKQDAKILNSWKLLQKTTAAVLPAKPSIRTTIIDNNPTPSSNEKILELTPAYLNQLVANAFHTILKQKYPAVVFWKYDEAYLLPGKIDSDAFQNDPDICLPLKHMFILASEKDIAAALKQAAEKRNGMRNLLNRVAKSSTKHLHQVWKEYKGIEFELVENGANIEAHILDKFNAYDLSRRSDGFKRFVSFLLHISTNAKSKQLTNTLYLDDEPDIGLHPSGAKHLRDELIKISKDNFVVYATHSIFMIDGANLERHLIVSKENEITKVEVASESNFSKEEVIFKALGYSIFEHLSETNIVFEGWRDKKLFEVARNSSGVDLRRMLDPVGCCFSRGVNQIGYTTAILELGRRHCIILSDSDRPAREQQSQYKGYGKWYRYDQVLPGCEAVTGEDFLVYDAFIATLNRLAEENPQLLPIPQPQEFNGKGNLKVINKWLASGGLKQEEISVKLKSIKEDVFAGLRPSHITETYKDLLKLLAEMLMQPKGEMNIDN